MSDPTFTAFCEAGLWPGLGRTSAGALEQAGIRGPDDVTVERLLALPGVGRVRAQRLVSSWIGAGLAYEVARLLVAAQLPARSASRVIDVFGDDAAQMLREDPWRLLRLADVSVAEADRFAVATLPEVRRDDPRRGRALVVFTLARAAREGHTVSPVETVASGLAVAGVGDLTGAVAGACEQGDVVAAMADGESVLALTRYADAEESCARDLARLASSARPFADTADERSNNADAAYGDEAGTVAAAGAPSSGQVEPDLDEELDETQRRAARAALTHGVSVLTGGPGTGKSRTVATVVRLAHQGGKTVELAAPTGRAAKRLEELVDAPAATLHRLLGAQPGGAGATQFARGPGWPIEADLVVVDEASMLDVELAAALVRACSDGTHLLFVGDPAQLPSIGPGRVLADLVESGTVPVTELTTLYRQAEGGAIARLATAVRGGDLPRVDSPGHEVVIVPAPDSRRAAHRVVQLVTDSIPRALGIEAGQIQVVTPVHRGPAGTQALNQALKAKLNPGNGAVRSFDVGDRVVATANHLDAEPTGYANGEVGMVVEAGGGRLTVEFATGPATVSGKAVGDLLHGWAITVHRAQGSEWPAVVAVLPPESGGLLSRPLVYTALTRAQRHLSVVHAAGPALAHAVRRIGAQPRRTRLREELTEALPE